MAISWGPKFMKLHEASTGGNGQNPNWVVATHFFWGILPLFGEDSQFDEHIFSNGLVQPPTSQGIDNHIILFYLHPFSAPRP